LSPHSLSNQASFPTAYQKLLSGITNWSGNSNSITVRGLWWEFRQGARPEIIYRWIVTNTDFIKKKKKKKESADACLPRVLYNSFYSTGWLLLLCLYLNWEKCGSHSIHGQLWSSHWL